MHDSQCREPLLCMSFYSKFKSVHFVIPSVKTGKFWLPYFEKCSAGMLSLKVNPFDDGCCDQITFIISKQQVFTCDYSDTIENI